MNKFIYLIVLILSVAFFAAVASAQTPPKFSQYAAKVEKTKSVTVNLKSHKDASMFRTNLRNAAKEGVNFAGHFILTGWGCGTNCSQWAVIDARNGKVFFPKEFAGTGSGFCELPKNGLPSDAPKQEEPEYPDVVIFKANSRMAVINGFTGGGLNKENAKCGNYFFEWTGTKLKQVKFIEGKRVDTP
ncbi:MAG: hypothetical protein IPI64_01480 [Chloracidobacterium sp.]|nr:hypothetical protein [Chloracidobacterium sp.]